MNNNDIILSVDGLQTYFKTDDGVVKAVDGVTFTLRKGENWESLANRGAGSRLRTCPSCA
jgi:ABC-type dipeptide/oligopeptide/nickel transport system ATPase component